MPTSFRWAYRYAHHHLALGSSPKVLSNSFHKAGTHLLVGALRGVPNLRHYGRAAYWHSDARAGAHSAGKRRDASPEAVSDRLATCLPGEIYRGHIAHHPVIADLVRGDGFKHVFIYRDPRDTVVSLLHWWKRYPRPRSGPYHYFASLPSDEDRLTFLIEGWAQDAVRPEFPAADLYPDITARFAPFLPWFGNDYCLALKFEDLVDEDRQFETYASIAAYLFPTAPRAHISRVISGMSGSVDPSTSKTFRKGKPGEWRHHFSERHVKLFKRYGGSLLVTLGYESDLDW